MKIYLSRTGPQRQHYNHNSASTRPCQYLPLPSIRSVVWRLRSLLLAIAPVTPGETTTFAVPPASVNLSAARRNTLFSRKKHEIQNHPRL